MGSVAVTKCDLKRQNAGDAVTICGPSWRIPTHHPLGWVREKLFIHPKYLHLLTSDTHDFTRYTGNSATLANAQKTSNRIAH